MDPQMSLFLNFLKNLSTEYDQPLNVSDLVNMNRSMLLLTMRQLLLINQTMLNDIFGLLLDTEENPLHSFASDYNKIHGYASLVTILFGVLTNILVITVLQQKKMKTPTNLILSALAFFDTLTMIPYIPFAIKFYIIHTDNEQHLEEWTLEWTRFAAFVLSFTATTHTISIWLVVCLSIFRYVQVRKKFSRPIVNSKLILTAKKLILLTIVISILVMVPHYLTHEIYDHTTETNVTFFQLKEHDPAASDIKPLVLANFLMYALMGKIIPCLLMIIFGGLLLYHVGIKAQRRHRKLHFSKNNKIHKSSSTTTLLVVMILFLITEFPQGILMIISLFVPNFYANVYVPLGDVMDFAALLNNSVNFVLYCSMSAQFRHTFLRMYVNPLLHICKRRSG